MIIPHAPRVERAQALLDRALEYHTAAGRRRRIRVGLGDVSLIATVRRQQTGHNRWMLAIVAPEAEDPRLAPMLGVFSNVTNSSRLMHAARLERQDTYQLGAGTVPLDEETLNLLLHTMEEVQTEEPTDLTKGEADNFFDRLSHLSVCTPVSVLVPALPAQGRPATYQTVA